ncbi:ArpU family phage packaging/lysis transcriptional regulator [Furfurilactobacillus sp. WILCCON 0119]
MTEVEELTFFPAIDDDQTVKNVRDFFTHKVPRFQRMSGWQLKDSLRSPVYDGMPKSHSNNNGAERAILDELERLDDEGYLLNAGRIIEATVQAVRKCEADLQYILIGTHVLHQSQDYIMDHFNCEQSQYQLRKRDAYLQFADYFMRTRKECHAGYPNLVAYANRKTTGV